MVFKALLGKKNGEKRKLATELENKLGKFFPDGDEGKMTTIACISGLMAKVAWCDWDVHGKEVEHIKKSLGHWTELPQRDIDAIVSIALEHTEELAGVEGYRYTEFLSEKFQTWRTLRVGQVPVCPGGIGRNGGGERVGGDSHLVSGSFVGTQAFCRGQGHGVRAPRESAIR